MRGDIQLLVRDSTSHLGISSLADMNNIVFAIYNSTYSGKIKRHNDIDFDNELFNLCLSNTKFVSNRSGRICCVFSWVFATRSPSIQRSLGGRHPTDFMTTNNKVTLNTLG